MNREIQQAHTWASDSGNGFLEEVSWSVQSKSRSQELSLDVG